MLAFEWTLAKAPFENESKDVFCSELLWVYGYFCQYLSVFLINHGLTIFEMLILIVINDQY